MFTDWRIGEWAHRVVVFECAAAAHQTDDLVVVLFRRYVQSRAIVLCESTLRVRTSNKTNELYKYIQYTSTYQTNQKCSALRAHSKHQMLVVELLDERRVEHELEDLMVAFGDGSVHGLHAVLGHLILLVPSDRRWRGGSCALFAITTSSLLCAALLFGLVHHVGGAALEQKLGHVHVPALTRVVERRAAKLRHIG